MSDEKKRLAGHLGANEAIESPSRQDAAELAAVLDQVESRIEQHLSLPNGAATAMTLFAASTHVIDHADFAARLALLSPVPECGKTTALDLLSLLVRNSIVASNITAASIFRYIDTNHPTLLIDEADTFIDGAGEITGILNSGHSRASAYVIRCEKDESGNYSPVRYSTWAPIVIAKIGFLPPALESRSIVIRMQKALPGAPISRIRLSDRAQTANLGQRLGRLMHDIAGDLVQADPEMPGKLANRSADNWRFLFAIAERIGGTWPQRAREAALVLTGQTDRPNSIELLAAIKRIFDRLAADRISSMDLCTALRSEETDDGDTPHHHRPLSLARALRDFGIRPKTIRVGDKTPKGYERKQFEDAFSRYVDDTPHEGYA